MIPNPWDLFTSVDGWVIVSEKLTLALKDSLNQIDKDLADNVPAIDAVQVAYKNMLKLMEYNVQYGATDTEPHSYLACALKNHLSKRFDGMGAETIMKHATGIVFNRDNFRPEF